MSARLKLLGNNTMVVIVLLAFCAGGSFLIFWLSAAPYAGERITENTGAILARFFSVAGVLVLCLTGIGSVWMGWAAIRGFIRPLQRLKLAAAEIRDGNLDYELIVTGSDEFSEVGRSFEEMRLRLKDSNRQKSIAEEERGAMMASICHDLKTPITSIMGYAEGILDGVADTPEKVREYALVISRKAYSLQKLTDDLSLLSRLENTQLPLELKALDIGRLAGDIAREFAEETPGMELRLDVEEGLICDIDREKFGRVLGNLLQNSVKYKKPEHTAPSVTLRVARAGNDALLTLTDNGRGIPQEDMARVYNRFYRADASRSVVTGSGLGLSIARQIITLHGGKTWMRSAEGGGATACVLLPLSAPDKRTGSPPKAGNRQYAAV